MSRSITVTAVGASARRCGNRLTEATTGNSLK